MVLLDTTQSEGTVETQLAKAAKYLADDSFAELKITDEPSFDKIASYSTAKQCFDKEVLCKKIVLKNLAKGNTFREIFVLYLYIKG